MSLHPEVSVWARGGGEVVLWHGLTGRHAVLSRETLDSLDDPKLEAVRRRLRALYMLAAGPQAPVEAMVPVPSRLPLLLHERPALWVPVPTAHPSGGHPWRALALEPWQAGVWVALNGGRTTSEVVERLGLPLHEVRAFLAALAHPGLQAVQLRDEPPRPRDLSLERLVASPRDEARRGAPMFDEWGATALGRWHEEAITDGATHFDERETTLAHALALPHPALGGRRYGVALRDALGARSLDPLDGRVVEVGCGTGELAAAWRSRGRRQRYSRVDRSPELLATQARNAPDTEGVHGDAAALPVEDASVDLLLCNEVLADLPAAPADHPEAARVRDRFGLPPRAGWVNVGAMALVEEVARVLRPGGAAYLSEFGDPEAPPAEATHLDHPEVSIHFGELARVARACGLTTEVLPLAELLGLDTGARWLWRPHFAACRALCRAAGRPLQARAWSAETVTDHLPEPVYGLRDVPLTDEGPGPLVTRFWALLLHKPPA